MRNKYIVKLLPCVCRNYINRNLYLRVIFGRIIFNWTKLRTYGEIKVSLSYFYGRYLQAKTVNTQKQQAKEYRLFINVYYSSLPQ